jgi:hypothetical protein
VVRARHGEILINVCVTLQLLVTTRIPYRYATCLNFLPGLQAKLFQWAHDCRNVELDRDSDFAPEDIFNAALRDTHRGEEDVDKFAETMVLVVLRLIVLLLLYVCISSDDDEPSAVDNTDGSSDDSCSNDDDFAISSVIDSDNGTHGDSTATDIKASSTMGDIEGECISNDNSPEAVAASTAILPLMTDITAAPPSLDNCQRRLCLCPACCQVTHHHHLCPFFENHRCRSSLVRHYQLYFGARDRKAAAWA